MRTRNLFFAMAAGVAFCACSDDELALSGSSSNGVFKGAEAYMTVSIKDVSSATRATSPEGSDSPFESSISEQDVANAWFYFYDAEGAYVSEGSVWDGGDRYETPAQNIEFTSNTVVVLKGLTDKSFPNYMVTVLNRPAGFMPAETLDLLQEQLVAEGDASPIYFTTDEGKDNFIMSTSSYDGDDDRAYSFVTEVTEEDFYTEPVADDLSETTPVEVYVERLAAKVTVSVGDALAEGATIVEGTGGGKTTLSTNCPT